MIYLDLWIGFLKVGLFSFGGAYSAIPLIRDVVLSYGWLTDEQLTNMIAISESTPGPIMVNIATYVGSSRAGFLGALLATLAVVLPAFVIILLLLTLGRYAMKNKHVQAIMEGLKPAVTGIILATGLYMMGSSVLNLGGKISFSWQMLCISAILCTLMFVCHKLRKKSLSPFVLIAVAAVCGIVIL